MTYYILAHNDSDHGWVMLFGDHDKDCVESERQDYRDHDYKAKALKILKAKSARQSDVDKAFAPLAKFDHQV